MPSNKCLPYGQTQAMNAVIDEIRFKMNIRLVEADIAIERGVKRYQSDQNLLCALSRIEVTNKKIIDFLAVCSVCGANLSNE